jgi:phage tail-like protein
MTDRVDPYRNFRFRLELGGIVRAGFSECTIPDTTTDPIEYREGIDTTTVRKLPGLAKYGNVTLKQGLTDDMGLFNWRQFVIDGNMKDARRDIAITLVDEEGKDKARWEFINAWPTKYDAPDLNAKGNDVAIESLDLVHEGMTRVS